MLESNATGNTETADKIQLPIYRLPITNKFGNLHKISI